MIRPEFKEVYSVQQERKVLKMYFDPQTNICYFQVKINEDILYTGKSYDLAKNIYERQACMRDEPLRN